MLLLFYILLPAFIDSCSLFSYSLTQSEIYSRLSQCPHTESLLIETRSGAHTTRVIMHGPTLERMFAQFKTGLAGGSRKVDALLMNPSPSSSGVGHTAPQSSLCYTSRPLPITAPPINLCSKVSESLSKFWEKRKCGRLYSDLSIR